MSFDVSPLGGSPYTALSDRTQRTSESSGAWFSHRRLERAADPLRGLGSGRCRCAPCRDLTAEGRKVRFDVHKLDGGVVASLVDEDGGLLRPLLLKDVVDVHRLSDELGKEQ